MSDNVLALDSAQRLVAQTPAASALPLIWLTDWIADTIEEPSLNGTALATGDVQGPATRGLPLTEFGELSQ